VNADAAQIAHRCVVSGEARRMCMGRCRSGRMRGILRRCFSRRRIDGCIDGILFERGNSMHT
jgi:hypothetical protein